MFLQTISKTVEDANFTYNKFMTNQHSKMSELSTVMDNKLTAQDTELINWNNKSVKELHVSQRQIDEFLTKNLCHKAKTGLIYLSLYSDQINVYTSV